MGKCNFELSTQFSTGINNIVLNSIIVNCAINSHNVYLDEEQHVYIKAFQNNCDHFNAQLNIQPDLLLQGIVPQTLDSFVSPMQGLPSCLGSIQLRLRLFKPPSHVLLHEDHVDHAEKHPSTIRISINIIIR